jgi:hypothetical protein
MTPTYVPVVQSAETTVLKTVQCGFESHLGHMMDYRDTGNYTLVIEVPVKDGPQGLNINLTGQFPTFATDAMIDVLNTINATLQSKGYETKLDLVVPNKLI